MTLLASLLKIVLHSPPGGTAPSESPAVAGSRQQTLTSVSGSPQRIREEEPGSVLPPTGATLKVRTALSSPICQGGDVLHAGDFRSGDTCHFRWAAGVSDVAGESVHGPPGRPGLGTVRWPGAAPPGLRAAGRNRKCHVSPLCLRGQQLRPGPPSSPGSAGASEPGVRGPAGLTPRASPRPSRIVAAGGLGTPRRHASALTCRLRVFRFSGFPLPSRGFPLGALGSALRSTPTTPSYPENPRAPWPSPGSRPPAAPQPASRPRTGPPRPRGPPTPTVSAAWGRGGRPGQGPGDLRAGCAGRSGRS